MMYVIAIEENPYAHESYLFFDTSTDSFFYGGPSVLNKLVTQRWLESDNLGIKERNVFYNPIYHKTVEGSSGSHYVLICKLANSIFKLAGYNKKIIYANGTTLKNYIQNSLIANCTVKEGKPMMKNYYKIISDTEFENVIEQKYKKFIAKSSILGHKISFEYTIENKK